MKHLWKILISIISVVLLTISIPAILGQSSNQASIISYRVTGSPNFQNPGNESFWSNIPWTNLSLTATVSGGGHTQYLNVRSAHNSTSIFILERWYAPVPSYQGASAFGFNTVPILVGRLSNGSYYYVVGPSRVQEAEAYNNGTLVGFLHNSTFYYPDRAAIMWSLGASNDCMKISSHGGSLSTGSANIWEWELGSTDNSTNDPAWSLWQNTTATGTPETPTHSFAINLYTNETDLYQVGIGGNVYAAWYNPVPGTVGIDPFNVWTAAKWYDGYWTLEFVRNFTTNPQLKNYEVQLSINQTYDVAFAVWQGYQGESAFIKSYTPSFQTIYISSQAPGSQTTQSGFTGNTYLIITYIGVILISAGVIIGIYGIRKKR